jgi:hypothetical protein
LLSYPGKAVEKKPGNTGFLFTIKNKIEYRHIKPEHLIKNKILTPVYQNLYNRSMIIAT